MMAMSGSGGFVLHTIKMCALPENRSLPLLICCSSYDDPLAEFTPRERRRKNKTPKVESERSTDSDQAVLTEDCA
jgi:hypothetical protein